MGAQPLWWGEKYQVWSDLGGGHYWTTMPIAIDVDVLEKRDGWSSHVILAADATRKSDLSLMNFVMTTRLSARFQK